jgi:hypothetical protein
MKFDVGTLFLIGVPLGLGCCILQLASWKKWRDRASPWWAAADGVGTVGAVLMLSYRWLPLWMTRSVAETLLFGGGLLLWLGFRRFAGQSLPLRLFAAFSLLYLALFQSLWSLVDDLAALIVLASFGHGLLHAGLAFDLARARLAASLRMRAFLVLVFALHALFYLFRAVTAVTVEAGAVFLHTVGLQNATLLFGLVNVAVWNAGALWMVRERYRKTGGGGAQA